MSTLFPLLFGVFGIYVCPPTPNSPHVQFPLGKRLVTREPWGEESAVTYTPSELVARVTMLVGLRDQSVQGLCWG